MRLALVFLPLLFPRRVLAIAAAAFVFAKTFDAAAAEPVLLPAEEPEFIPAEVSARQPAVRSRAAQLNPRAFASTDSSLRTIGAEFQLELFPGEECTLIVSRSESPGPGRWTSQAAIKNVPGGQCLIAADGESAAMTVFWPGRGRFRVLPETGGRMRVAEVAPQPFGLCGSSHHPELHDPGDSQFGTRALRGGELRSSIPPQVGPVAATVSIIDVMVVYTPAALAGAGGEPAMGALIDLAVAEANTVYQNSQAAVRLRLAHRGMVGYAESGNLLTNLNRLQASSDGFMDEVHSLRTEHQADLVCLFTEDGGEGFSGLAFTMTELSDDFRGNAFSVVSRKDAVGGFLFVHEISHNLGCHHDREHAVDESGNEATGLFDHSYGHKFVAEETLYHTVMAYPPGDIIPFLSNPDVFFLGVPTGIAEGATNSADNVATINTSGPVVSGFFGPLVQTLAPTVEMASPAAGASITQSGEIMLEAIASDSDGTIAQVEFYRDDLLMGVATALKPGGPAGSYEFSWKDAVPGEFAFTARALDNSGAVSASAPHRATIRPHNDLFANRTVLDSAAPNIAGSNRSATVEPAEPQHASNPGGASVWFEWRPARTGTVTLETIGDGFLPLIEAYRQAGAFPLVSITRSYSFDEEGFAARISFDVVAGSACLIALDGFLGAGGEFTLAFNYAESPANDLFANRAQLAGETAHVASSNAGATREAGEPVHAGNQGGKSVWFAWRAPVSGTVVATASGATFFALCDVYSGASLASLAAPGGRSVKFLMDELATRVQFDAVAGQEYVIAVDGTGGGAGDFTLDLAVQSPPAHDNFSNRQPIFGSSLTLESANSFGSRETGEPMHAQNPGGRSVWFSWTAPASGRVTVTSVGEGFYTLPDVYTGASLDGLQQAPNYTLRIITTNITEKTSIMGFSARAFETYAIAIDGFQNTSGPFRLTLEAENAPPVLESFSLSALLGRFELRLSGKLGQIYVVESSSDLKTWSEIARAPFATLTEIFADPIPASAPARFYRVLPER